MWSREAVISLIHIVKQNEELLRDKCTIKKKVSSSTRSRRWKTACIICTAAWWKDVPLKGVVERFFKLIPCNFCCPCQVFWFLHLTVGNCPVGTHTRLRFHQYYMRHNRTANVIQWCPAKTALCQNKYRHVPHGHLKNYHYCKLAHLYEEVELGDTTSQTLYFDLDIHMRRQCIGHTRNWCAICRGKTAPKDFFFRRGKTATVFHRSGEQIQSHKVRGFSEEYQSIVNKVRRVVKVFKRSPTKNDNALQPYVKREFSKEVSVILDWRTRWSSLADMFARFLQLRSPVQKALIDLGQSAELTPTSLSPEKSSRAWNQWKPPWMPSADATPISSVHRQLCSFALFSYRNKTPVATSRDITAPSPLYRRTVSS